MTDSIYDAGLEKQRANHAPLTPLNLLERAVRVYPELTSVVYGERRYTWRETYERCVRLASALSARGIGRGDTVAMIAANIPEMYEAHFGVPMSGAVLNTINVRLDARTIAFILAHGEARLVFVDRDVSDVVAEALRQMDRPPAVVDIDDAGVAGGQRLGETDYEAFLASGDADFAWRYPDDEWDAISLNYTSGTTGQPKGVVYHHRGAYLNALANSVVWNMDHHPVYLWTLPMFHCNGWCFPWTLAALGGTSVCLRKVSGANIYGAIAEHKVDHFCGAPTVLGMVVNAGDAERRAFSHEVKVMTAAAPPPASILARMEEEGFRVTHVYGLTETYGPATACAWKPQWDALPAEERARLKARQGVRYHVLFDLDVLDPETMTPVPRDGETLGEIMFRGNLVMKGYLKNPEATAKAFAGGWFHSGDLAVVHPDNYLQIRDRSKDIIISGGENISSIEVEDALYAHPAVLACAVVACPHEKWGETPCAFVELKEGAQAAEEELIRHCRERMAHFKAPTRVVFGPIPKTSTGKVQKFKLRDMARAQ